MGGRRGAETPRDSSSIGSFDFAAPLASSRVCSFQRQRVFESFLQEVAGRYRGQVSSHGQGPLVGGNFGSTPLVDGVPLREDAEVAKIRTRSSVPSASACSIRQRARRTQDPSVRSRRTGSQVTLKEDASLQAKTSATGQLNQAATQGRHLQAAKEQQQKRWQRGKVQQPQKKLLQGTTARRSCKRAAAAAKGVAAAATAR